MNIGKSITKAIDEMGQRDNESAMLHACNAVDGTAKRLYPNIGTNAGFTKLLRDNYHILGPMIMPGIDLVETRFPITIRHPKAPGGTPDIADIIYGIHRCTHGHGAELPDGFELIEDVENGLAVTRIVIERGKIRLSDRTVFGLIAVAVICPKNIDQAVPEGYYLTLNGTTMYINEWWGRSHDFSSVSELVNMPSVKMDFGDWMNLIQDAVIK